MSGPSLRPTLAVGFDAVLAFDPSMYEITEDARGRAYAFDMTESRDAVAEAVRQAVDRPEAIERVEIEPGYARVRYVPPDREAADLGTFRRSLKRVPSLYNERHATDADLDGLALDHGKEYFGTYRPTDAPDREAFLDRHAGGEAVPETDGTVFTYERDGDGTDALDGARRFAYEIVLPFDTETMYATQSDTFGRPSTRSFRWDAESVRQALAVVVEDLPEWPGGADGLPRVAVYPTHVVVEHYTNGYTTPAGLADSIRDALLRYNRYRTVDEERSNRPHEVVQHPPLSFSRRAYIGTLDHGRTAEEWIAEQSLDAVGGEPVEADGGQDGDAEREAGGRLGSLNPFGG